MFTYSSLVGLSSSPIETAKLVLFLFFFFSKQKSGLQYGLIELTLCDSKQKHSSQNKD